MPKTNTQVRRQNIKRRQLKFKSTERIKSKVNNEYSNRPMNEVKFRCRTIYLSHTRTVVREFCKGDDQSQWEKGNLTPATQKPLNRCSAKFV